MMTSVFLKTLRDLRGQILGWGIGLSLMSASLALMFPMFENMTNIDGFIEMLPPALQTLFGDKIIMHELEDFLRLKLFDSWLPILLAVLAIIYGAGAIAGEEERKTIDLLMANPIARWRICLEKFAAIAAAVTIMTALTGIGLLLGILITGLEVNMGRVIYATFNSIPFVLVFGSLALWGSCMLHRPRHASAVAVTLLIISYFIYTLAPLTPRLTPWLKVNLFHYYVKTLPYGEGVELESLALILGLTVLLLTGAVAAFRRKDILV